MAEADETSWARGTKLRAFAAFVWAQIVANIEAIMSLGVRAASVAVGFVVTYQIGHKLGAEATGQFALVTQTALFLAIVGLLGLDISVVRHFARAMAEGRRLAFVSLLRVVTICILLMVLISLLIWAGGEQVWIWLFSDSIPNEYILVLGVLLIGRAGTRLFGALLRSQHMFTLGQMVPSLIIPLFTAAALATGLVSTIGGALWAAAIGGLVALAIGAGASFSRAGFGSEATHISMKAVLISAMPLWGVGVAQNLADWYGLAVATHVLSVAETGLFRVAAQIAAVLQIATMALFSVYSAKISTAFHSGDRKAVAGIAAGAVRFSTLLAVPVGAGLILCGPFILGQIGPEFADAYPALVILVIGQIAICVTGPCGLILAMSGHEMSNLRITLVSTVFLLIALPLATMAFELKGLCACVSLAVVGRNLVAYWIVLKREGIEVWSGKLREPATD